ncbi:hypothetical protein PoB_002707700 [Plakobranchus ocellatus]|uniref:Uncharacterized protein n=1 Tax=Plakobranchus ocellatus TaxID=259542 RepID=A0AAV4A108_9GAST|nr:hypothetical protein PoB_002707700 [Plakobranchus ocellatus]
MPLPFQAWAFEAAQTSTETSLYIEPMGRKDETCPLALKALPLETIAKYSRELALVYSDGSSTNGMGTEAIAFTSFGTMVLHLRYANSRERK